MFEEFKKTYKISRAILWNSKTESFYPRAYSATVIAINANNALDEFKSKKRIHITPG